MGLKPVRIEKILYATDLSESAVHAFSYAISLGNLYGAGITILHVLSDLPIEPHVYNMIGQDTWQRIRERHVDEVRHKLIGKQRDGMAMREVLAAFSEGQGLVTDDILIERGDASDVIVETARERSCDLIVMGTHGIGGIAETLIGSTAKRVVRKSRIPVLIVRLPD